MKRGGPLRRSGRIRPRSTKTAAAYAQRRKLVAELLHDARCEVPDCPQPATDVHEPLTRARGGSILDPANCRAVCRSHHDEIHTEPAWAYALGFLIHSWDAA